MRDTSRFAEEVLHRRRPSFAIQLALEEPQRSDASVPTETH